MYRTIAVFPKSADPSLVDDLVDRVATAFKGSPGCRAVTLSVDHLLGPGAKSGEFGRILEADFETLDDAMAALGDDDLQETKEAVEALDTLLLLFEAVDA